MVEDSWRHALFGRLYRHQLPRRDQDAGLGTVLPKNQDGKFLLPTAETITAAASVLDPRTPSDERLSLVFAPGDNSYPLINYEYAMVSIRQPDPATAAALRHFLLWAIRAPAATRPNISTRLVSSRFRTLFAG